MPFPDPPNVKASASYVLSILATADHTPYIGEPISQLQHSLQCASLAATAQEPPADEVTQVAALLHDIGQFAPAADVAALLLGESESRGGVRNMGSAPSTSSVGRVGHEALGAALLSALGFPDKVARLVGAHVAAKRYLCAVDPGYHARLSEASQQSLTFQGGPMEGAERDAFAASEWCGDMCRLRKWDDEAKVEGLEVRGLESWREVVERVLEER